MLSRSLAILCCLACTAAPLARAIGPALSPPPPGTRFEFGGVIGERVTAAVDHWLVPAPAANPGIIGMFHVRDRKPVPQLVPWAGEFVGKYLIGAVQHLRMSDSEALRETVVRTFEELYAAQDTDGYLGPFRKEERLLGNWDLWGHYHILLALLMWHDEAQFYGADGQKALDCARGIADLACNIYLNTDRRPIQAGSEEMNLSFIHGLGVLYRKTNEQRYFDLMRVFEEDWKQSGDYFRQGLAGVPFYKTPKPRWESLHAMQGLGELYRITGNEEYKTAYINLWESIRRYDRHNTGGFSTGEQAIGNPYTPGAIETCCTIAWTAITKDILELSGDPLATDELELSLYNSILGSQHPSGRWYTYDTPMNGKREASQHTIVFQARAGTPEFNCCSANAARGLGMLTEWAVMMRGNDEVVVNYTGPMKAEIPMPSGKNLHIEIESHYPFGDGAAKAHVKYAGKGIKRVIFRDTYWSRSAIPPDGNFGVDLTRIGAPRDHETELILDGTKKSWSIGLSVKMDVRPEAGDLAQLGRASFYRGPVLLAYDQRDNTLDCADAPTMSFTAIYPDPVAPHSSSLASVLLKFRTPGGPELILRDFASAGATGTEYMSWVPVAEAPPAPFDLEWPTVDGTIPAGPSMFRWAGSKRPKGWHYVLEIGPQDAPIYSSGPINQPWHVVRAPLEKGTYPWRVRSVNPVGETVSRARTMDPERFTVDPALPNNFLDVPATYEFRVDGLIVGDYLDGKAAPVYGHVDLAEGLSPAPDRHGRADGAVAFSGNGQVRYRTPGMPGDSYTISVWFRADGEQPHLAQIFSAWSRYGDDPLRIVIDGGKVHARIEGGGGAGTRGAPVEPGKWTHAAAVKNGGNLKFYLNGVVVDSVGAPALLPTLSKDVSIGANPHHTGDEHFTGAIDDLALYARALGDAEVRALAVAPPNLAANPSPQG